MGAWAKFNAQLQATQSEAELLRLLRKELSEWARPPYIERLYGRFSRLRSIREREALFCNGKVPRG